MYLLENPYSKWLFKLGLYETRYIIFPDEFFDPEEVEYWKDVGKALEK